MRELVVLLGNGLCLLLRARQMLVATFGFSFLLVVVASFSFRYVGMTEEQVRLMTPGILWLLFLFTGVIALNHSFSFERDNRALRGVLLTSVEPSVVFTAKCLSNIIFLMLLQVFIVFTLGLFWGVKYFGSFFELLLLSFLLIISFASLGTLLSGMAAEIPGRDVLLPLVLFPVSIPLLAGVVELTREVLMSGGLEYGSFWFKLLVAAAVMSYVVSWALFEHVVNE